MRYYISHCIRGKDGIDATDETMAKNSKAARDYAAAVRVLYPDHEFYCPGEHEDFIAKAYRNGDLSEEVILRIDCEIVSTCGAVLVFLLPDKHISRGMRVEIDYAVQQGLSVYSSDGRIFTVQPPRRKRADLLATLIRNSTVAYDKWDPELRELADSLDFRKFLWLDEQNQTLVTNCGHISGTPLAANPTLIYCLARDYEDV